LSNFAVVICHDVGGVTIDADEPSQLNDDASFLHNLAHRGISDGFAKVHRATGECPRVVVDLVDEQDSSRFIAYRNSYRRHHAVGRRRARIVVVIDAAHAHILSAATSRDDHRQVAPNCTQLYA
jgi:hypothetical protein